MLTLFAMLYTSPMPFAAAAARLESKTPVAANLSTAQWDELSIGLRDRAFFSARVTDARILSEMQSRIRAALDGSKPGGTYMTRDRFIAEMRQILGAKPGDSGELTDITSYRRLGLIYDFNTEDAMEYGRWMARQDPDILDAFPCSELVRVEARRVPRGYRKGPGGRLIEVPQESWPARWAAAGGEFTGGRMIARKDDLIWISISRFGRPWPPFDFESGMGLADVSRSEAIELGAIAPEDPPPQPQHLDFNHNLQASIPEATPSTMEGFRDIFGDQVDVSREGLVIWQGQRIADLYKAALADSSVKWSLDLGVAPPATVAMAKDAGADLEDARLIIEADEIRHAAAKHGEGEARGDQRPLTSLDFQLVPQMWREPDAITAGDDQGTLVFTKDILGKAVMVTYDRQARSPKWAFLSMWIKKKGGTP
jgi:hypothetical protein